MVVIGAQLAAGAGVALGAQTLTVTTAADLGGSTCGGTCSLRQAIAASNATPGDMDTITFAIPTGQSKDITVASALPPITDAVTIDGRTQPGVRLLGTRTPSGTDACWTAASSTTCGLVIRASGTIVRGLEIRDFPGSGILLDDVAHSVIGGPVAADGNRLIANANDGVTVIGGNAAIDNQILGNVIHGNGDGSIDLGDDGVAVGDDVGDGDQGPNGGQNSPAISTLPLGPVATIHVFSSSRSGVNTSRVEVFWASTCLTLLTILSITAQSEALVGTADIGLGPGLGGSIGQADIPLSATFDSGYLTATATTLDGTSEMTACARIDTPTDEGITASASPSVVDVLQPTTVTMTVTNHGPFPDVDVLALVDLSGLPSTIDSVSATQGTCQTQPGVAFCVLGSLDVGASATMTAVFVPTAGGVFELPTLLASLAITDPNPANDTATVALTVVVGEVASGPVVPGGSLSTGSVPVAATPTDPVETSVSLPITGAGGQVSISESAGATPPPTGYGFVSQAIVIIAPPATAADPLVLTFTLDASQVPATPIVLFRNGVPVLGCSVADPVNDPSATPDPCVFPPVTLHGGDAEGDIQLTVRTSAASTWRLGMVTTPYSFSGFFTPVDNEPTLNRTNVGSAIPIKFGLGGDRGLGIFQAGYPKSVGVPCGNAPVDTVEQTVTVVGSSLKFDAATGRYQYNWKTDKAWRDTCRKLVMAFADGSTAEALFSFTK